ncbi:dethiobiotin synthase [Paenibacillus sp. PL2-23]|uniref:dethiobiotin synthase n=1 Tax=Paenibacillus sp. PL2-23 TaxID=2100729 RepID=UPI0030F5A5EF
MKRWRGIFVTGTDTGVGKTVVTAAVAAALREKGWHAGVWKPVQSGGLMGNGMTDAECLLRWTGLDEQPEAIAPFSWEAPLAPMLAARLAGLTLTLEMVMSAGEPLAQRYETLLIEGAGGVAVPLAEDALIVDLMAKLQVPALIVARAGLGTINHTLLTAAFLRQRQIPIVGVVLNEGPAAADDPSTASNTKLIELFGGLKVLGCFPRLAGDLNRETLVRAAQETLDLAHIGRVLAASHE